ncbi:phosphotransferase [Streptomyces violaceusniger]|uniref:phosphotransferase n=1 Tax=Streptomyces violaceusniger TaxID=68280 RepID=UPI0009C2E096|nr:phosphotransferase [Streptomyces hygroscopicus]AQW53136.1 phosphotransferase [Streptomyces hygroscopicus]
MLPRISEQLMQPEELMDNDSPHTEALWALVRPHTGEQHEVQPASRGNGSDVSAIVKCEHGPVFIKACRNRSRGRRASMVRERLVNPLVRAVSPKLWWHAEDEEWTALGFEVLEGRSSDFTPDSPDLPVVVDLLDRIGGLRLPAEAYDWPETRWNRFASERDAKLFKGETLLFTDVNPDNFMIGKGRAWAVDWSWPTRGAGFIDPACLVVQLIAAGHSAEEAEVWVSECKAWMNADAAAIDAFAAATLRMSVSHADRHPDAVWLADMADAARAWAAHRGVSERSR